MRRPLPLATALALVAVASLAGCGRAADPNRLRFMAFSAGPAEDEALRAAIAAYQRVSPVRVELNIVPDYETTLQAALAGGNPPDVFYVNDIRLPDLASAGVLAPIGDQVENPADFHPALRRAFSYQGRFYCPPKDFSTLALAYDQRALAAAGVAPPRTWAQLREAARRLTRPGRKGLVMEAQFERWGAFLPGAGGWLTDAGLTRMTANTPQVREGFGFLAGLHRDGLAATPGQLDAGWSGEALARGKAAMAVEGTWLAGAAAKDFPHLRWAAVPVPAGPRGGGTLSFSVCLAVAASSPVRDRALGLVRFLTSPSRMTAFTDRFPVMPSRRSLTARWTARNPRLAGFASGVDQARSVVFRPGFPEVLDALNDGIQGLAVGDRRLDEVLERVDWAGRPVLAGGAR